MQQHHACSIGQQAKGDAPTWEGSTRLHEPLTQLHSCRRAGRRTRARHGEEMLQRGIERGVRCEACPSSTIHIPHTMTRSRHAQHTLSTRGEARRLGSSSSRGRHRTPDGCKGPGKATTGRELRPDLQGGSEGITHAVFRLRQASQGRFLRLRGSRARPNWLWMVNLRGRPWAESAPLSIGWIVLGMSWG